MNKLTLLAIVSIFSMAAHAEDKSSMHHSMGGMGNMGGMMKGQMSMMNGENMDTRMRSHQSHMLMMHDYSNRILAEKDPVKKQKLKDQQLDLMKAHHKKMMQKMMKMQGMNK